MAKKFTKISEVIPRFHLVFMWHRGCRRYLCVGSSIVYLSEFRAADFVRGSSPRILELWRIHNYDLDSVISMPCSTWRGFSSGELPF